MPCPEGKQLTTVVVSQSNFLPWKGYFDLVRRADRLVLLENVQFTRRDWRSRNRIKTPQGVQWISVPVHAPNGRSTSIAEVEIAAHSWADKMLRTIELNYCNTPYFDEVCPLIEKVVTAGHDFLSELNEQLLRTLFDYMEIATDVTAARGPTEPIEASKRIADIVKSVGGTRYLTGPAAMEYLRLDVFDEASVSVAVMEYPMYPEYDQVWPPFRHDVSIVDLLFHLGREWMSGLMVNDR